MKCSNCGEPVEEGRLFCLNCGQEIQWVPDYDSFGTFMEQQERLKKEKEEAERREKLRAAAAAEAAGAGFDNGADYGCAQSSGLYTTRSE